MFRSYAQFFESSTGISKLNQLKTHLDRTNVDLAKWIVDNLGVKHEGRMTEKDAVNIIKTVNTKEWWPKLPTMYFFDSPAEDVKEGTILVHFTRDPEKILKEGFKYGEPDYLKLGMNWGHISRKEPGFNYAFDPKDLVENYGSLQKAFLEWVPRGGAIFFRAPAIKDWHFGDEIDQVLFWGPDAHEIKATFYQKGEWEFKGEKFKTLDESYNSIKTTYEKA